MVYKWYILPIEWVYMKPIPPIKGNQKQLLMRMRFFPKHRYVPGSINFSYWGWSLIPPLIGNPYYGVYKPLLWGWWPSPIIWKWWDFRPQHRYAGCKSCIIRFTFFTSSTLCCAGPPTHSCTHKRESQTNSWPEKQKLQNHRFRCGTCESLIKTLINCVNSHGNWQ